MALWLLDRCVKLQSRLESDPDQRDDIQRAIDLSVTAVKGMRDGHQYDIDHTGDPVRQAADAVFKFFPEERNTIHLPKEKPRSTAIALAIQTFSQSAGTVEELNRIPINVTVCKRDRGPGKPTDSETHNFTLSVSAGYTLDDLLFVVRLHHPGTLTRHPYLYSRPVNAHFHTSQGSKFEWKKESDSLQGLPRTGPSGSGSVYFVIPEPKFILLVEGVPLQRGDQGNAEHDDKLHIIHDLDDLITSELSQNKDRRRTFHHYSETWKYTCKPFEEADITWADLISRKRLTLFRGEWIACVE